MSNSFDFEQFKANAIEQLKAGVPLSGKDVVLAPLLENLLDSTLDGEMDRYLEGSEREKSLDVLIPGDSRPPIPVILGHPC